MCVSGRPGGKGGWGAGGVCVARVRADGAEATPWNLVLDVELRDRPLSARVRVLVVDALAVALHLGQVLVEDFARPQRRHEVVELAAVVLAVRLRFAGLALPFPLLFELRDRDGVRTDFLLPPAVSIIN